MHYLLRRLRRVKLILPALTEATSPYWRPIKYSLFPPLGLATLAAYLDPELDITLAHNLSRLKGFGPSNDTPAFQGGPDPLAPSISYPDTPAL